MNIWYVNPYDSTPNQQATRTYDFARELVRRGHCVTIFCSGFNHYTHVEDKLKDNERWKVEVYEGIRIVWLRTTPYWRNDWRRTINMFDHARLSLLVGVKFAEQPDIIVGASVPIFSGLSAYILSMFKGSRFIFEVRDLWPQTLIDLGFLSERSVVTWILRMMEKFLYVKASRIITVLPYAHEYICSLGVAREKVVWIPNGIDFSRYSGMRAYSGGLTDRFVVMYVGGQAAYHGIEVILEAAEILQSEGEPGVKFVLVGDGPEKARLMSLCSSKGLKNVEFRGLVPKHAVPGVMEEADALVAIIRDLPVLRFGINPNKLFDYMASGRPIIFGIRARNNPVAEAEAGITVPPGDAQALAGAIKALLAMPQEARVQMGRNGYEYAMKNYDIWLMTNRLENVLQEHCR